MATTVSGYSMRIRQPDGTFVAVPATYQTIYSSYLQACASLGITDTLSLEDFYATLGNISSIADAFTSAGVLAPAKGGTGYSTIAALINGEGIATNASVTEAIAEAVQNLATLENLTTITNTIAELNSALTTLKARVDDIYPESGPTKTSLEKLGIGIGTANPSGTTPLYVKY